MQKIRTNHIVIALLLLLPALAAGFQEKGSLYLHPMVKPAGLDSFPSVSFDRVARIVFQMNDKYKPTAKKPKQEKFRKEVSYVYGLESAKTLGYKLGVNLVVMSSLSKEADGLLVKMGLFDVKKKKVINETEEKFYSFDSLKVEGLGVKVAMQLAGKPKKSFLGKILTWSAVAGALGATAYLATVFISPKKEENEPGTQVSFEW